MFLFVSGANWMSRVLDEVVICMIQLQLKINGLVGAANERARRRELLLGFGADPHVFLTQLQASQARDVRSTQKGGQVAALRRTEFFQSR